VLDYVERMELVYAAADIVIARAGATTVAEIAAVGLPAILVPYPYARRDHQRANASALAKHGGAFVVSDEEATTDRLVRMVDGLAADVSRLRIMGDASKAFGKPSAAARLADWVFELAEGRP
jgi:UDP-N-acetylglucosamine--N-acetylmuramyl-(pentapeptide) pyrophosphoryl-undecaprenol N-acetylglucosamine transferase